MKSDTDLCSLCLEYVLDELCELDKKRFQRHFRSCQQCQKDRLEYLEILEWVVEDYLQPKVKAEIIPLFPQSYIPTLVRKRHRKVNMLRFQGVISSVVMGILIIANLPFVQGAHMFSLEKSAWQGMEAKASLHVLDLRQDAGVAYHRITGHDFDL